MTMEWILLGTGAADWQEPRESGEYRGYTSTLLDSHILLDCTENSLRKMEELGIEWAQVTDLFFTHSHDDHCDVEAVRAIAQARQKGPRQSSADLRRGFVDPNAVLPG